MTEANRYLRAIVRRARPADGGPVADVYLASRHELLPFAPLAHDDDDVRRWIQQHLLPSTHVTVAEVGDRIVAFCATITAQDESWIDQLYVHPAAVGNGLGTRLLEEALSRLPRPVRLYTFQANAGARRFYRRHGFAAEAFGDGSGNEEGVPDVRYVLVGSVRSDL